MVISRKKISKKNFKSISEKIFQKVWKMYQNISKKSPKIDFEKNVLFFFSKIVFRKKECWNKHFRKKVLRKQIKNFSIKRLFERNLNNMFWQFKKKLEKIQSFLLENFFVKKFHKHKSIFEKIENLPKYMKKIGKEIIKKIWKLKEIESKRFWFF